MKALKVTALSSCSMRSNVSSKKKLFFTHKRIKVSDSSFFISCTVADMNAINSVTTKTEEESKDDEEEEEFIKYGAVDEFYELGKEIGRGSYGTVKKCIHKERRNVYAVKMIKTSNHAVRKNVLREIEVMRALGTHDKLVLLHDAYQTPFEISMVLEFVPGGELFERIVAEEYLMEDDAIDYVTQILEALEFMHEKDIVHLDLKPENILCVSMDNHDIKLVDFGLARDLNSVEEVKSSFGTPDFVAPEVIRMKPVSRASDLWSLGVVTYVLLSGLMPFSGDDDHQTLVKVAKADWDFDDDCFDDLSDDAKEFIEGLLVKEPSKRLTIDECFRHPWIKDTKDTVTKIHTQKHRAFMAKRRWKKSVNALLAVRRMSLSPLFSRNRRSSMDPSLLKSATEADEEPQSPERKGSSPLSAPGLNAPGRCTRRSCFDLDMETIKALQKKANKACGKETHRDDCECKEDGAENERLGGVTVDCSTELENDGETEEPSTPRRRASTISGATSCQERKTSQISIAIGDAAPKRDFEPVCFTFDTNELQQNDKLVLESNTAKPAQVKRKNATNGSPKSTRDSSRFTNDTASSTTHAQQVANCVLKPQKFTWQLDQSQGVNNDGLAGLKSDSVERIPTICVNDELCPTNPSSISVTLNNNIEKMDQKEMGAGSLQTTSGSLQTSTSGLSMATVNLIPDGVQSITVKLDDFNNGLQFPAKQVSCHVPRASTGSPVNLVGSSFVRIARP